MLKLPFFNRKRYVVLKCYTDAELVNQFTPVTITAKCKHDVYDKRRNLKERWNGSFKTCYGNVKSYRTSVTVPCWHDYKVIVEDRRIDVLSSQRGTRNGKPEIKDHTVDPDWHSQSGLAIFKIASPWAFECGDHKDLKWVYANHILNTTNLNSPSGMLTFYYQHDVNIFFKIDPKYNHQFEIPFKTPLAQLYPLTDLPLEVETSYNPTRFHQLKERGFNLPHMSGVMVKMDHHKLDMPPIPK